MIMQAIEARALALRTQLQLFPLRRSSRRRRPTWGRHHQNSFGSGGDQVRTMGPDELSAFDDLTAVHGERGSLEDVRRAIAQRRRELAG